MRNIRKIRKIRDKVLKDQDMTLDNMSVLVADVEAMDIVNNSLKSEQQKLAPGKGQKTKEDGMLALEVKPGEDLKAKEEDGGEAEEEAP